MARLPLISTPWEWPKSAARRRTAVRPSKTVPAVSTIPARKRKLLPDAETAEPKNMQKNLVVLVRL